MKELKRILVFVMLVCMASCSKNIEENQVDFESNQISEPRSELCGDIPELCVNGQLVALPDGPIELPDLGFKIPNDSNNRFIVKKGQNSFYIQKIESFRNSNSILVASHEGTYVYSNVKDSYLRKFGVQSTTHPRVFNEFLEVKNQNVFSDINAVLAFENSKHEFDKTFSINLPILTDDDVEGLARIDYCKFVFARTIDRFWEYLIDETSSPSTNENIAKAIENALEGCKTSERCESCPDPQCTVNTLINDPAFSGNTIAVTKLKKEFAKLNFELSDEEELFLDNNTSIAEDAFDYYNDVFSECKECDAIAKSTSESLIKLMNEGIFDLDFDDPLFNSAIVEEFGAECVTPLFAPMLAAQVAIEKVLLKQDNPSWSEEKINRRAYMTALGILMLEKIHLNLDLIGLIPGAGEIADVSNGVIYSIEGKGVDAALSFSSAIPITGWVSTGSKFAYRAVTTASGGKTTLKIIIDGAGKATFGSRSQLRRVLGLCKGDGKHAHHIFSWVAGGGHDLVQFASKKFGFHLNEIANGIGVIAWRNQPNHHIYDSKLVTLLNDLKTKLIADFGSLEAVPKFDMEQALKGLQDCIRANIINNPSLHLNDLDLNC